MSAVVIALLHRRYGPLYYVANAMKLEMVSAAEAGPHDRVTVDSHGHAYDNDRWCLTRQCIKNSLRLYVSGHISEATNGAVNVHLSAKQLLAVGAAVVVPRCVTASPDIVSSCRVVICSVIFAVVASRCRWVCHVLAAVARADRVCGACAVQVPMLFPVIVALCLLLATLTSFHFDKFPVVMTWVALGVNMVGLPILLLLSIGFFLPVLIAAADTCSTYGNLAYNFATRSPDMLCAGFNYDIATNGSSESESFHFPK
jgi:hypothetical protein